MSRFRADWRVAVDGFGSNPALLANWLTNYGHKMQLELLRDALAVGSATSIIRAVLVAVGPRLVAEAHHRLACVVAEYPCFVEVLPAILELDKDALVAQDMHGRSALWYAIAYAQPDNARKILSEVGIQPPTLNLAQALAMSNVTAHGYDRVRECWSIVNRVCEEHPEWWAQLDSSGQTPLMLGVATLPPDVILEMLEAGAKSSLCCEGYSTLWHAAYAGRADVTALVVDAELAQCGADVKVEDRRCPLIAAIMSRDIATLVTLLDKLPRESSSLDRIDCEGNCAMAWAAYTCDPAMMTELIARKPTCLEDSAGHNPLWWLLHSPSGARSVADAENVLRQLTESYPILLAPMEVPDNIVHIAVSNGLGRSGGATVG